MGEMLSLLLFFCLFALPFSSSFVRFVQNEHPCVNIVLPAHLAAIYSGEVVTLKLVTDVSRCDLPCVSGWRVFVNDLWIEDLAVDQTEFDFAMPGAAEGLVQRRGRASLVRVYPIICGSNTIQDRQNSPKAQQAIDVQATDIIEATISISLPKNATSPAIFSFFEHEFDGEGMMDQMMYGTEGPDDVLAHINNADQENVQNTGGKESHSLQLVKVLSEMYTTFRLPPKASRLSLLPLTHDETKEMQIWFNQELIYKGGVKTRLQLELDRWTPCSRFDVIIRVTDVSGTVAIGEMIEHYVLEEEESNNGENNNKINSENTSKNRLPLCGHTLGLSRRRNLPLKTNTPPEVSGDDDELFPPLANSPSLSSLRWLCSDFPSPSLLSYCSYRAVCMENIPKTDSSSSSSSPPHPFLPHDEFAGLDQTLVIISEIDTPGAIDANDFAEGFSPKHLEDNELHTRVKNSHIVPFRLSVKTKMSGIDYFDNRRVYWIDEPTYFTGADTDSDNVYHFAYHLLPAFSYSLYQDMGLLRDHLEGDIKNIVFANRRRQFSEYQIGLVDLLFNSHHMEYNSSSSSSGGVNNEKNESTIVSDDISHGDENKNDKTKVEKQKSSPVSLWRWEEMLPADSSHSICFSKPILGGIDFSLVGGPVHAQHIRTLVQKSMGIKFVSRWITIIDRASRKRTVLNKEEMRATLSNCTGLPVRFVQLEKLSFRQQVSVMASTAILVSVHGAGLTNLIFLPRNAAVIELLPFRFDLNLYERVAFMSGHKFFRYFANERQTATYPMNSADLMTTTRGCMSSRFCGVISRELPFNVDSARLCQLASQAADSVIFDYDATIFECERPTTAHASAVEDYE